MARGMAALFLALATSIALASKAEAGLGTPVAVGAFDHAYLLDALSGEGHRDAIVVWQANRELVLHRGARGRWRRITITGESWGVQLAHLENGGGLVAWARGDAVF